MDPDRFREALQRHSLTQKGFGRLIEVDERTVRRWATGDQPIPATVVLLFLLMERFALTAEDLGQLLRQAG